MQIMQLFTTYETSQQKASNILCHRNGKEPKGDLFWPKIQIEISSDKSLLRQKIEKSVPEQRERNCRESSALTHFFTLKLF